MKFDNIQKQVKQQRCAGFSYAQEKPAAGFRDVVTVYCDGRVCALWAPGGADEAGRIQWDYSACAYSGAQQAPKVLTGAGAGGLVFDGKPYRWALCEQRKTDKQNGYGALKTWWLCHFGK